MAAVSRLSPTGQSHSADTTCEGHHEPAGLCRRALDQEQPQQDLVAAYQPSCCRDKYFTSHPRCVQSELTRRRWRDFLFQAKDDKHCCWDPGIDYFIPHDSIKTGFDISKEKVILLCVCFLLGSTAWERKRPKDKTTRWTSPWSRNQWMPSSSFTPSL